MLAILGCLVTGTLVLTLKTPTPKSRFRKSLSILLLLAPIGMIALVFAGERQADQMLVPVDSGLIPGVYSYESSRLTLNADQTYHLDGAMKDFQPPVTPAQDGHWTFNGDNLVQLRANSNAPPTEIFVFWYGSKVALYPFRSEADLDPDVLPPSRFLLKTAPSR
ncbi:MAG TPA: hypothetical protein VNV60_01295 [Holophagaceae bacterium]|jgi:hypothetical protein|nr:hypothetical protein [Holophagaceae bacterium]